MVDFDVHGEAAIAHGQPPLGDRGVDMTEAELFGGSDASDSDSFIEETPEDRAAERQVFSRSLLLSAPVAFVVEPMRAVVCTALVAPEDPNVSFARTRNAAKVFLAAVAAGTPPLLTDLLQMPPLIECLRTRFLGCASSGMLENLGLSAAESVESFCGVVPIFGLSSMVVSFDCPYPSDVCRGQDNLMTLDVVGSVLHPLLAMAKAGNATAAPKGMPWPYIAPGGSNRFAAMFKKGGLRFDIESVMDSSFAGPDRSVARLGGFERAMQLASLIPQMQNRVFIELDQLPEADRALLLTKRGAAFYRKVLLQNPTGMRFYGEPAGGELSVCLSFATGRDMPLLRIKDYIFFNFHDSATCVIQDRAGRACTAQLSVLGEYLKESPAHELFGDAALPVMTVSSGGVVSFLQYKTALPEAGARMIDIDRAIFVWNLFAPVLTHLCDTGLA